MYIYIYMVREIDKHNEEKRSVGPNYADENAKML